MKLTSRNARKRHLWGAHAKAVHRRHGDNEDGKDREDRALHLDQIDGNQERCELTIDH